MPGRRAAGLAVPWDCNSAARGRAAGATFNGRTSQNNCIWSRSRHKTVAIQNDSPVHCGMSSVSAARQKPRNLKKNAGLFFDIFDYFGLHISWTFNPITGPMILPFLRFEK